MYKVKKHTLIFLSVLITFTLYFFLYYLYKNTVNLLYTEYTSLFMESIKLEQHKRIIDNNFTYSIDFHEDISNEFYLIKQENEINRYNKKKEEIAELHTSRVYKGIETSLYLQSMLPDIFNLDSVFQSLLINKGLPYKIAVKYIDNLNNIEFSSSSDSAFYLKADTLSSFTTGVRQELTFKGYVAIPSAYVFRQMKVSLTIIGMIWLICMGIIAFILFRKDPVKEEKNRQGLIPVTKDISFDKARKCLIGQDKKAQLTRQQVVFFDLLLKDPERYAYYEEMRTMLWADMVFSQDNMTQMISRVRKSIQLYPELEIRNIAGVGYQLYVRTEEELKEFLSKKLKKPDEDNPEM